MDWTRRKLVVGSCAAAGSAIVAAPLFGKKQLRSKVKKTMPGYVELHQSGELARREKELWKRLSHCDLCPRSCGANRLSGQQGTCGLGSEVELASAHPHFGEESPLVGSHGSGTFFFSHCNLLCCFCQNWEIAHRGEGQAVTHRKIADIMISLQRRGCHNINVVTPTHVLPHIITALRLAAVDGLQLPLVYNCGGYERKQIIELLDGIFDIYMPDFKFMDSTASAKYLSGAADYPQQAAAAIAEMHRQVGVLRLDERGVAQRGLLLRHLVMPDNLAGTDKLVKWIATELSPKTYVNIMAQYHPAHRAFDHPEIARGISRDEYLQAIAWAKGAGLGNLD